MNKEDQAYRFTGDKICLILDLVNYEDKKANVCFTFMPTFEKNNNFQIAQL